MGTQEKLPKYIFITGGVVSGLGKGITAASLGRLLVNRGLRVTIQKLDPYINVDAGTMSPYQHGEVFVLDDGAETDLDIGHYERFLGRHFTRDCNSTMGKIYQSVIAKERRGEYLGKDVQVVPHVTNEIKVTMRSVAKDNDIVIVEVGGTVGEIEGQTFVEAIRQFRKELGRGNSLSIHVTLVPYLAASGAIKTKPTQASVHSLVHMGISPDIIVCRTSADIELDIETRAKIADFCNLSDIANVIHNRDCETPYEVPLMLRDQNFDDIVLKKLGMRAPKNAMTEWRAMVRELKRTKPIKKIAVVGKYVSTYDSYLSVLEAINHAAAASAVRAQIQLIDSVEVEEQGAAKLLAGFDGILVPGGFGNRGVEGKIMAAQYARENNVPYFGICLGMQIAVIEFARNVVGLHGANSTEFDTDGPHPIIHMMSGQKTIEEKGGTMRLGLYPCKLLPETRARAAYGKDVVHERHRHRYEFNNKYREQLKSAGMVFSGVNVESDLVEIIELPAHPYFVAGQFHPEFLSKPYDAHPLFAAWMRAICK